MVLELRFGFGTLATKTLDEVAEIMNVHKRKSTSVAGKSDE